MKQSFWKTLCRCFRHFFHKVPVFYIHGADVLPDPLTPEEEQNAFRLLRENPEKAREQLICHNLRLVVYIAKKFESSGVNIEDLISIGTIGLIKAVNTFCPEKNIKLATYASRCIENEILMYLRKIAGKRNEFSMDEPLNVDFDGNELLLSDVLGTDGDEVSKCIEERSERDLLYQALSKLPKREQEIIVLRFGLDGGEEQTQKEVATRIGISQSYISRLEKRIYRFLRKELIQSVRGEG